MDRETVREMENFLPFYLLEDFREMLAEMEQLQKEEKFLRSEVKRLTEGLGKRCSCEFDENHELVEACKYHSDLVKKLEAERDRLREKIDYWTTPGRS